ncbi:hypothetical protein [Burkholderia contaminans]|uniref:Uncharacterized protein n=1 Tax=Burkholderia contaminans TaxID=488447 RepID=A0A3N8QF49_9BURK|nr:hypothetical protein [Burkholderia contaminans]RQT21780.1 hypothetical protein DF051_02850 [Burkholderia contaminans]
MNDAIAAYLVNFAISDVSPIVGQTWLLDDESGAPYTPLRFSPSPYQVHEWQCELVTALEALAVIERWPNALRYEFLQRVLWEPGLALPPLTRQIRELVQTVYARE